MRGEREAHIAIKFIQSHFQIIWVHVQLQDYVELGLNPLHICKPQLHMKCVTRLLTTQSFHLNPNSHTQISQSQNIGPNLSNLTLSNITQVITQSRTTSHNFTQRDVGGGQLEVSELICRQAWRP